MTGHINTLARPLGGSLHGHIMAMCAVVCLSICGAFGQEGVDGLRVIERQDGSGVTLVAESKYNRDFTITVEGTLVNATASSKLPLTVDSAGRASFALVRIQRDVDSLPWHYTYKFHWKRGGQQVGSPSDHVYALPFAAGEIHRVIQGNFGRFSHYPGSQSEYAVDWEAPIGTVICAARNGVVTGVRQDSNTGGADPKFKDAANYIIIKHDDGTYAEYLHIQSGGALVRLGDDVATGQPIARSGNTGWTTRPHFHFAVFQTVDGNGRVTLPCRYLTPSGIVEKLEEAKSY